MISQSPGGVCATSTCSRRVTVSPDVSVCPAVSNPVIAKPSTNSTRSSTEKSGLIRSTRAAAFFADAEEGAQALICSEIGGEGRDRMIIDHYGRDDVFGGLGRDTLDFRKSPMAMTVGLGNAYPNPTYNFAGEDPTNSLIYGVEVVYGSQYADDLRGSNGKDALYGFGGNDYLFGGDGDDRLFGGDGEDTVDGSDGSDTCEGEHLQSCND